MKVIQGLEELQLWLLHFASIVVFLRLMCDHTSYRNQIWSHFQDAEATVKMKNALFRRHGRLLQHLREHPKCLERKQCIR